MSFPIVFIHTGYSDYMEYSLRQAKQTNPDAEIILLGDEANDRFPFVTHVNIKDYFKSASEFAKIYKHFSTNPYHYELFCIQRWFILKEYMEQNNIEEVFVCDTDVMIYSNIKDTLVPFKNKIAILKQGEEYSFGISYILKCNISKFCNFIINSYTNKSDIIKFEEYYKGIIKNKKLGGISDMTFVENWLTSSCDNKDLLNMLNVINDSTFDDNINSFLQAGVDNYRFKRNRKSFIWRDKIPFCYNTTLKKDIRFHIIHCQGPSKYVMSKYYTGNNFQNKLKLDFKFSIGRIAAYWYKRLRIRYRFAWLFNIIFKLKSK